MPQTPIDIRRYIASPGDIIDGFEVQKRLGEGTFGIVYKVKDTSGKIGALKMLKLWEVPPEFREQLQNRFKLEFETGQIASDYLVHTVKSGQKEGNPYILMEFCPNGDLRSRIHPGQAIPLENARKIASQILLGLNDLHKNGKIHRDLKPDNVLFDPNEVARLTDFGITGHANLKLRLTVVDWRGVPKEILGTYAYMPPEQIKPMNKHVTILPTTDVFSFGVILFEMLAGQYPYGPLNTDSDLADYIQRMKKGQWDDLRAISKSTPTLFIDIIEGCLEPDFKKRTQGVEEILQKLGKFIETEEKPYDPKHSKLALKIMQGEEHGKTYKLSDFLSKYDDCVITIGRKDVSERNDIEIQEEMSAYISRRHATIERISSPPGWFIRDGQWSATELKWKSSLNGTYVNSTKIGEPGTEIIPGDIITMGDTTLKVINL